MSMHAKRGKCQASPTRRIRKRGQEYENGGGSADSLARPKSSAERWASLVEDAKRIVADRGTYSKAELRWALDTLSVHESGHSWHSGAAGITVTPEQAPVVKPPIIMKPPITQVELAEVVARFASVVAMSPGLETRSDPDSGGSDGEN